MTEFLARLLRPRTASGWVSLFAVILCLAATIRIALLVFHSPVIGYANSYDMIRIQSCLHLWVDRDDIHHLRASATAPVEYYKINTEDGKWCYYTSELLFASAGTVLGLLSADNSISIRAFGFIHMMAFLAAVIAINRLFWNRGYKLAMLANSAAYLGLFSDPAFTVYFNSLYAEFSATLFLYLSIALLYLLLKGHREKTVRWFWYVSLIGLGLSKVQHCILPAIFLLVLLFHQYRRKQLDWLFLESSFKAALIPLVIVLLLPNNNLYQSIAQANAYNTYVATVLRHTGEKQYFSELFNINETCQEYSAKGMYWVDIPNVNKNEGGDHPCPEIVENSRWDLLKFTISNPGWLATATQLGVEELRPWISINLGQIQKQRYGRVWDVKFTIGKYVDMLKTGTFDGLLVFFVLSGVFLLIVQMHGRFFQSEIVTMLYTLSGLGVVIFYVSIFGDGLLDFWKHCNLIYILASVFYLTLLAIAMNACLKYFGIYLDKNIEIAETNQKIS